MTMREFILENPEEAAMTYVSHFKEIEKSFRAGFLKGFELGESEIYIKDQEQYIKEKFNYYINERE